MKLILQIALGVMLGIMLSGFLSVMLWGTILMKLIPLPTPKTELPPAAISSTDTEKVITQLISAQPALITPPVAAVVPKTAAEIEAQQQQLANQEEKGKKDAAFKSWYQKPPECFTPNDHGHDVKIACGNHYMRAKAEFDELWQQGKFKN